MRKKICNLICLLFLSGFAAGLLAQANNGETKMPDNNTYEVKSDSLIQTVTKQDNTKTMATLQSCVNSFTNQTVSSKLAVLGCNTLSVQNVTVTSSGDLSLTAPDIITINATFEVQSGGVLYVGKVQQQRRVFDYQYENSGNRKSRTYTPEQL